MKNRFLICIILSVLLITDCEKPKDSIKVMWPWIIYGQVTDREGYSYRTLQMGDRTWMVDNLKTVLYKDGTNVPVVPDAESWDSLSTPGCCWQNNDPARRVTYGVLYNWYVINTGKLCPAGWHVPSNAEWSNLIDYLGGENVAGGKLKETGFKHWESPNTGATNETSFWAYPGGERSAGPEALFQDLGEKGSFWTATAAQQDEAEGRTVFYDRLNIQKHFVSKKNGLSVRCILD